MLTQRTRGGAKWSSPGGKEDKQILKPGETPTLKLSNYGAYIINESGLYSLILSSKLETAKAFKRWVTAEVLPSTRKHGEYVSPRKAQQRLGEVNSAARIIRWPGYGKPPYPDRIHASGI